jgi:hypothetical protein
VFCDERVDSMATSICTEALGEAVDELAAQTPGDRAIAARCSRCARHEGVVRRGAQPFD